MTDKFDQHQLDETVVELGRVSEEVENLEKNLADFHASDEWASLSKFDQHISQMTRLRLLKSDKQELSASVNKMKALKGEGEIVKASGSGVMEAFQAWRKAGGDFRNLGQEEVDMFACEKRDTFRFDFTKIAYEDVFRQVAVATDTTAGRRYLTDVALSPVHALAAYGGGQQFMTRMTTSNGANFHVPNVDDTANSGVGPNAQGGTIANQDAPAPTAVQSIAKTVSSGQMLAQNEAVMDTPFDLGGFLISMGMRRCGKRLGSQLATGDGSGNNFLGFVEGANGNYQAGAAQTGAISIQNLIGVKQEVDRGYWQGEQGMFGFTGDVMTGTSGWVVNNETEYALIGMRDGQGRPVLAIDWQSGAIPRILGQPVVVDSSMADGTTNNTVGAVFGNFGYYLLRIVDQIDVHMIQDTTTLEKNQRAYYVMMYADGRPFAATTGASLKTVALAKYTWR